MPPMNTVLNSTGTDDKSPISLVLEYMRRKNITPNNESIRAVLQQNAREPGLIAGLSNTDVGEAETGKGPSVGQRGSSARAVEGRGGTGAGESSRGGSGDTPPKKDVTEGAYTGPYGGDENTRMPLTGEPRSSAPPPSVASQPPAVGPQPGTYDTGTDDSVVPISRNPAASLSSPVAQQQVNPADPAQAMLGSTGAPMHEDPTMQMLGTALGLGGPALALSILGRGGMGYSPGQNANLFQPPGGVTPTVPAFPTGGSGPIAPMAPQPAPQPTPNPAPTPQPNVPFTQRPSIGGRMPANPQAFAAIQEMIARQRGVAPGGSAGQGRIMTGIMKQ